MKQWTFICFLLLCLRVQSQDRSFLVVKGHVKNSEQQPLVNATVAEVASQRSVVTKKDGSFLITVPANDVSITIVYQGYHSFIKKYSKKTIQQMSADTLVLEVILVEKIEELATVDIEMKEIELTYGRASILVLDYVFYRNGLLLLIKEKSKYKLRHIDENDSLKSEIVLPFKYPRPKTLYKDCFNNCHIRTPDSVYQVFDINEKLVLDKGLASTLFDRTVLPCAGSSPDALYMGKYGSMNQSLNYYQVNKQTGLQHRMRQVKEKQDYAKGLAEFGENARARVNSMPDITGEIDSDQLKAMRNAMNDAWFYQRILTKQVYHPLFSVGDSVVIFDHFSDSAFVYNHAGELKQHYAITHHTLKGWASEILVDAAENKFYAKKTRNGIAYLIELDRHFKTVREYKISKHIYPAHIRVNNGYAYYLYNTMDEVSVQNLFRQRLK